MAQTHSRRAIDLASEVVPLVAVVFVVFRSAVWLFWEHAYFDADQSTTGLMAKHLIEGRAWPLLFYGQHYLLAIESWMIAPFVGVLGASVFSIRLPIVLLNLVIALLLIRRLVVDVRLKPWAALVAALFFVLPGPITSSRLVDVTGAAIEPFLYTLLLWILRQRPVAFGLVAGVGIAQREFTAYAVAAVWLVEAWHGRAFVRGNLRNKAVVVLEIAAINLIVTWLKPYGDLLGPGTGGTFGPEAWSGQAAFMASRLCLSPAELGGNFGWLFRENLSALFGYREGSLALFVTSRLNAGTWWGWVPLAAACIAGAAAGCARRRAPSAVASHDGAPAHAFPVYLVLVGLQAVAVYVFLSCDVRDLMYIRYTLLALFIPIGLVAAALRPEAPRWTKTLAVAATLLCSLLSAYEDGRVLNEYRSRRPPNHFRQLSDYLEREGIRYGTAGYWTAYPVVFFTDERVLVTARDKVRVREYDEAVNANADKAVEIFLDDACTDPGAVSLGRWCVLHVDRARQRGAQQ